MDNVKCLQARITAREVIWFNTNPYFWKLLEIIFEFYSLSEHMCLSHQFTFFQLPLCSSFCQSVRLPATISASGRIHETRFAKRTNYLIRATFLEGKYFMIKFKRPNELNSPKDSKRLTTFRYGIQHLPIISIFGKEDIRIQAALHKGTRLTMLCGAIDGQMTELLGFREDWRTFRISGLLT